jgi:hypothetical protein
MIVTLDSKHRLAIPAALAPTVPGDCFDAQFDAEEDTFVFRRITSNSNWLAVLKECPVHMGGPSPRRPEFSCRHKS